MQGMKASAKKHLKNLGITKIEINKKSIRLENAKTTEVVKAAIKHGW